MKSTSNLLGLLAGLLLFAAPVVAQEFVAVDNGGALYSFDPLTGCSNSLVTVLPGVQEINSMAKRPSDGHLFIAGAWTTGNPCIMYEVDPASWTIVNQVTVTALGATFSVRGMAFDSAGTLYLANWDTVFATCDLWTCDETTGVATLVGNMWNSSVQALAWDETNNRLIGWSPFVGAAISGVLHIDPLTGSLTDPNPAAGSSDIWEVQGLGFDDSGRLMSIGQWPMQEFDPVTGDVLWTSACANGAAFRGIEFIPAASMTLALTGSCPGLMTADLAAGTPGGTAAIAWSFGNVGFTMTTGPCAGTSVALSSPASLIGVYTLDAQGAYSLGPINVNPGACGNIWVQAVDLTTCDVTAAAQP